MPTDSPAPGATQPATAPDPRRWWTLAVLCLSLVMVIVGNTVLNVALPTLVRELGATATELQWIVDAYGLVFAGLLLTGGALGDRFGRKGALTIGLAVFGLASAVSALATSADQLVATRAVMGLAAALVMPATLSILTNVFPPHERARAIAVWAGLAGAGAAVGPIASGYLLEHFSWGSVFLVNVPIVVLALVAGRTLVPTSRDPAQAALDPVGAGLSIVGLAALLYGIIEAPTYGWTGGVTLGAFAVAAVALAAFAAWELRVDQPMLDLRFFRNPRFSAASTAITLVFFAMFGMFFLLTQYLQLVKGYTALEAGIRTLPVAMTMMVCAPLSARLVEWFGPKRVVATGLAVAGVGLLLMSRAGVDTGYPWIGLSLTVMAVGVAVSMAPATASIMSSLPLGKAGVGSAVNDTTRELGGALGVAVLGSLVASSYRSSVAGAATGLPARAAEAAAASLGGAVGVAGEIGGAGGAALAEAARVAFADAMGTALLVAAAVTFVAAAVELRWLPSTPPESARRPPVAPPLVAPAEPTGASRQPEVVAGSATT